jgi:Icc-related predicted phosphoesterase
MLSLKRMQCFLETHDPTHTIIVTHHAPSLLSLPPHRRENKISCAYASHLDAFIKKHQPFLWIHGHIHHSIDYYIGSTRVLSNPQGYPDDPNPAFNSNLILKLTD